MAQKYRVTQDRLAEGRQRRSSPVGQDLFAGLIALMLITMMATGFIWVVMRSFGGGAFIFKAPSPTILAPSGGSPRPSATVKPGGSGSIMGTVSSNLGSLPAVLVCAKPVDEAAATAGAVDACMNIETGAGEYKLPVSSGTYYLSAKTQGSLGALPSGVTEYFSEYVTCKRDPSAQCASSLKQKKLPVPVAGGAILSDIDIIF